MNKKEILSDLMAEINELNVAYEAFCCLLSSANPELFAEDHEYGVTVIRLMLFQYGKNIHDKALKLYKCCEYEP